MIISVQESTPGTSMLPSNHPKKLVLAESQPIIFQPLLAQLKKTAFWVSPCYNYQELIESCNQELPDILVIGTLPQINSLEVYRRCRNQWQNLPIILLVNQLVVNDSFKSWAIKQGITNVVSSYPQAFPMLLSAIEDVASAFHQTQSETNLLPPPLPLEEIFSVPISLLDATETMELGHAITALNQLTEYSNRYFGPLAIGNYWRKTRANVVETHPWLNEWNVDHWGKIEYLSNSSECEYLTIEQVHILQVWTRAFLKECQRVVVDFPKLLHKKHLSPQIDLLISSPKQF